jgi:hypothetical protein
LPGSVQSRYSFKKTGKTEGRKNLDKKINSYRIKRNNIFKYLKALIYEFVNWFAKGSRMF